MSSVIRRVDGESARLSEKEPGGSRLFLFNFKLCFTRWRKCVRAWCMENVFLDAVLVVIEIVLIVTD